MKKGIDVCNMRKWNIQKPGVSFKIDGGKLRMHNIILRAATVGKIQKGIAKKPIEIIM